MQIFSSPIVLVDVETTGGSPTYSRITEIACLRFEAGKEVKRFVSLINPESRIPLSIEYLTGINNQMIEKAPTFRECAEALVDIFEGAILVAHNARFDYSFIKAEMRRAGYDFQMKLLCTARLSRKLFPHHRHHNLSALIDRYDLTCSARHRALGDTEAMRDFLLYLERTLPAPVLEEAITDIIGRSYLPLNIDEKLIQNLPNTPGVYFMYAEDGTLLYIGKSKNIKTRVISHFMNTHGPGSDLRLWQETKHIDILETGSDLGASLLELNQIKTLSPLYNRRSRRTKGLWYLVKQTSKNDYPHFQLEKKDALSEADFPLIYGVFRDKRQAVKALEELMDTHLFCPQTFGLEKMQGQCFRRQIQKCSGACAQEIHPKKYTALLELTFAAKKLRSWPYQTPLLLVASEGSKKDFFHINHWLLHSAHTEVEEGIQPLFPQTEASFDYETYKLLSKALLEKNHHLKIYTPSSSQYKNFLTQLEEI